MAWSNLANNQMVSYFDASTSGFVLNSGKSHFTTLPAANQCMTKADALLKYNLNPTFMSSYASLQLVPKTVWVSNVSTFISTWDTTKTVAGVSSASNQIRLPLVSGGSYTFTVNWGDGTSTNVTSYAQIYSGETVARTHTYTNPGVYTVSITGTITGWRFQDATKSLLTDYNKIKSIQSWGPLRLGAVAGNIGYNFAWCDNLSLSSVTDVLNLTGVTSLKGLFMTDYASGFYLTTINRINEWNTAAITDMSYMFHGQSYFNSSVSNWITNLVTNMSYMFAACDLYDQPMLRPPGSPIWNTGAVTDMSYMFLGTIRSGSAFNQNISTWPVTAVRNMKGMFSRATSFNNGFPAGQAGTLDWTTTLLGFGTGNGAEAMRFMFSNARSFNCSINSFNTANVTSLESTFENAILFNNGAATTLQIGTSAVTSLKRTFYGAAAFNNFLPTTTYWITNAVTDMSETFAYATSFNKNIGSWNTGAVTTMYGMFRGATVYNNGGANDVIPPNPTSPITWNTINVTNMSYMFADATKFNQTPNFTNTLKVLQWQYMFKNAVTFNRPLNASVNQWNVTGTFVGSPTMKGMFEGATKFNNGSDPGVTESLNWGTNTVNICDMSYMFKDAISFNAKLRDGNNTLNGWKTSNVCSMAYMFAGATSFNQPLPSDATYWNNIYVGFPGTNAADGQPITGSFENMFAGAAAFNNGNVANTAPAAFPWRINSALTNVNVGTLSFYNMFKGTPSFNQNISTWTTDRVTNMSYMFDGSTAFNGSLASSGSYIWNTSAVTNFVSMFSTATAFNGNITNWNTSAAQYMQFMFNNAPVFNQNIGSWSTNNVLNMSSMFYGADAFNQNIGSWNISNVSANSMSFFMGTKTAAQFSTDNLNAIYNGWSTRPANVQNISFFQAKYTSAGQAGRNILTGTRGWTIVDGGGISSYSGTMIVGVGTSSYGYGPGEGSLNSNSIPLFGSSAVINTLDWMPNIINFTISGVPAASTPNNWTTITIGTTTYNRTQFSFSFGSPYWYIQLSTTSNPFGTTAGATINITIT